MHRLKKPLILLLIIISIVITYNNKYNSLIKDFENNAKSEEAMLNRHINLISGYIEVMAVYGDIYFSNNDIMEYVYTDMLHYDAGTDSYNMDFFEGTTLEKSEGNLTGKGKIPSNEKVMDEIGFALHFNKVFNKIAGSLPDVIWLSYVSENNFVYRYPFKPSSEFKYSDELKQDNNYIKVKPENNPNRKSVWSPVYYDKQEKQLIFSYSTPIYLKDSFMGVVNINFSNARLSELMNTKYESYLIDERGSVIASSRANTIGKTIAAFNDIIKVPTKDYKHMWEMVSQETELIGSYYMYSNPINNAPWRMFMRVSAKGILLKSIVTTIPILLICSFLLLTIYESEKRKKTEKLLKNTINELKSYQVLLESAAKMDFLTTTFNRRGLKEKWNESLLNIVENKIPVSFLLSDIDNFKNHNDTFGHPAGDKALIKAAEIMKNNTGKKDIVCRWGGEEFLIVLYNKNYEEALMIAEKIRKEMEAELFIMENSEKIKVTMTLGVSDYIEGETIEACVAKADRALYKGKETGKNRVVGCRE